MSKIDKIPGYTKVEDSYYKHDRWHKDFLYWSDKPEDTRRWYESLNSQKRRNIRKVMAKHNITLDNNVFGIVLTSDMFNDIIKAVS